MAICEQVYDIIYFFQTFGYDVVSFALIDVFLSVDDADGIAFLYAILDSFKPLQELGCADGSFV